MTGRIFLGLLTRRNYSPLFETNFRGCFSHRSYGTAQKIETISDSSTSFTGSNSSTKKTASYTYEQIKNSPELQKKLAEMYKQQAGDPEFEEVTRY